jgi:hypothetical protein
MTLLAHVERQRTTFHAAGWKWWFLRPLIWKSVSGLIRFRNVSDKGTASNCVQISEKVQQRPWQSLDKRLGTKAWAVHEKSKFTEIEKRRDRWRARSRARSSFSLTLRHKEFILADQKVNPRTTVTFYGDCLKCAKTSLRTLATRNRLLHHDNSPYYTSFFTKAFLTEKIMTVVSHPPYFSVSPIEGKTEKTSILKYLRWWRQNCRQFWIQNTTPRIYLKKWLKR